MDVLTILGSIVGVIVGALTVGAMVTGFLKRFTRQVFAEDVLSALKGRKAEYREFHAEVFASELDRGRRTADIVAGLQADLRGHSEEFRRFANAYSGHQELLITIPRTVVHLDESIKRLDGTMSRLGASIDGVREEVSEVRENVAWLKAKVGT